MGLVALLVLVLVLLLLAVLGGWVAAQRDRSIVEGLILGLLYGPLGVIVEALLPLGSRPPAPAEEPDDDEPLPAMFRGQVPELPAEPPRKAAPAPFKDLRL
jgi:hypothetical protein